ncbi:uncharacterized protein [Temnothorax longispinosus]|uniref:uncharacterized protein isoform X4 n=1 Tax=Temnothorax longispinosus TaxID=300112 RepID=UPI003A99BA0D
MSPFEIIGIIDMIKQFPLDYMHLLCLGTMKKLLLLWIRAMGKSEEALAKLAAFNDFYRKLAKSVPAEFSRHPRSLEEVAQWKATEFRLFLLYLGPVVLQHLLSKPQIIHFNVLNCAVRILCDPRECVRNNSYAQDLMIYFVDNMELLYGEETLIYNIHNLIHIPEDVLNHGPLDSFSCFPFENFLQKIKLMIKGGAQPLAQFIKRITERSIHLIPSDNSKTGYSYLNKRKNRLDDHQLPPGYTNFHQEIQFQDFLLTDKSPNNCCYLSNNSVVLVEHICCYKEIPVIVGRQFINTHSIADYPCDSRNLGIFDGRELSELQTWNIDEIDRKGFVVPYDADSVFKTYIMTHPDSLHQRNWRKRPRFLFRFSRQPIFHITDLHILLVNSQDMAAIQKHHNKQKRSMPSQASKGISQAKIIKIRNMYLPPNKFKAGTDTANILNNSGVQIIENSSVAPVQNANKKYVSQSQKRSAQKISTSSSLHQDQTILEYLEDNAETAEEQDDEYTYTEFLEDSSNDEVVGNDEVVENDEVRENDEVVENDEENNNQGDEVIVNREDRPEIHPHDAAVCCNGCRQERKDFENCILQKLNELLEVGRRNDNPVERIDRHHYALLPQMPFTDINELQRFDRDLKDNGQMRDQFMKKIQDIGGKSVQKAVKYAMEVVITDDLTQQVVWTLGAENKPKISKFTFPYVIIDVVRNTFEGTKIKTVEDRIAEWLRRGGDRKKAENKRRERQNLQHQ